MAAPGGDAPQGVKVDVDRGLSLAWTGDADAQLPLSLTASDGTGLQLVSLGARAVVEGPLSFTELHLVFDNPEDRQREGRFEITLPPSAAISRFAMRIGERWQEAEVVERQAARVAYEDFLHRKQDPALLEKKAGNQFRARVFPIPARSQKELILSYSEQLPAAAAPYTLRLSGLPTVERFELEVLAPADGGKVRRAKARADKPADLKDVQLHIEDAAQLQGLRYETLVMGRTTAKLKQAPQKMAHLTVAFDTSGSRALGFEAQVRRLTGLIEQLRDEAGDFPLRVVAFDQEADKVFEGKASRFDGGKARALLDRMALGASDAGRMLDWLAAHPPPEGTAGRVLWIGDGVVTAGQRDAAELRKLVGALGDRGYARLDAIADGGIRDEAMLSTLVDAGLGSAGVLLEAAAADAPRRLLSQTRSNVAITVPGARWWWPLEVSGLQDGDELLVFAHLDKDTPMRIELAGIEGGEEPLTLRETRRPLLERAWVGSDIARMSAQLAEPDAEDADRQRLRDRILELSVKHRVLSDLTALLVLETEADYARFKIERNALTDILHVGQRGVEQSDRQQLALATKSRAFVREAPTVTPRGQQAVDVPEAEEAPADTAMRMDRQRDRQEEGAMGSGRAAAPRRRMRELHEMPASALQPAAQDDAIARMEAAPGPAPASAAPPTEPASAAGIVDVLRGRNVADVLGGGALAKQAADGVGFGGLGLRGTGRGGGAQGGAAIGLGSLGTIGRGAGGGSGSGYGRGAGGLRGRSAAVPQIRVGTATVDGAMPKEVIRRIVRRHMGEVRFCYEQELGAGPRLEGTVTMKFVIEPTGSVETSAAESSFGSRRMQRCVAAAVRRWTFPQPSGGGKVVVTYPMHLQPGARPAARPTALRRRRRAAIAVAPAEPIPAPTPTPRIERPAQQNAYKGSFGEAMALLASGKHGAAHQLALAWRRESPGDVLALVALGESLEAAGDLTAAARAYGTLIDLFPSRADLRRMAGERLDRLGEAGQALALDTYRVAVEQRPDHPSSHRLYAYALVQEGLFTDAFAAIEAGLARQYPDGRFAAVKHILREDLGLMAAAWTAAAPDDAAAVRARLQAAGAELATKPSTRFVLHWETDANDVDLHVYDDRSDHAYYGNQRMVSGGRLYADVTTGYGPECFAIEGAPGAYPYTLQAHYYSRGPMGYGMGKLQIVQHDGKGKLFMQHRPFVVMNDQAYVDLGTLDGPLPSAGKGAAIAQAPDEGYVPPAPEL